VPEIEFRFDQSVEQHARIEDLIHEIHEQDAARQQDSADALPPAEVPHDDDPTHRH
jgi:hypothetical protein